MTKIISKSPPITTAQDRVGADGILLSIIVTTYDLSRSEYLKRLVDSISIQSKQTFEVIFVVENHVELLDFLNSYLKEKKVKNFRVIFNDSVQGISASRNMGVLASSSDFVSMVDDDVVLPETWVGAVLEAFENENVVAVTGPVIPHWEDQSMQWLPPEFHWLVGCSSWSHRSVFADTRNVWGANMAFRKAELVKVGGFSTEVGGVHGRRLHGEENELCLRLNSKSTGRIVFSPAMIVYHSIPRRRLGIRPIVKSSYDMGRTRRIYSRQLSMLGDERRVITSLVKNWILLVPFKFIERPRSSFSSFCLSVIVICVAGIGFIGGARR